MTSPISPGMNGRFFPNNWRPATQEIEFARNVGFTAMQFVGPPEGLGTERLGADFKTVAACLRAAGITAVMEIPINIYTNAYTADGRSPLDILQANLPAIKTLDCTCVHYHLVLRDEDLTEALSRQFEQTLSTELATAVQLAQEHGFRFGIEHNEPDYFPFNTPESCAAALRAVPDLGFVWDFNHTASNQLTGYKDLAHHVQMLHISDTPLPETNYHWPLGRGNLDFADYFATLLKIGFNGPAILEIGGLPKSGGYGQDTDEALIASHAYLQRAIASATTSVESVT